MRAELHLARRYLLGLGRRTHIATVSLISLIGLGLGVMALVVTLALLEGFQSSIRRNLVEQAAHARVRPVAGRALVDAAGLVSVLQERLHDVEMVQVVRGTCLVTSSLDAVPASVVGRSDAVGVSLDRVLAARLAAGRGDLVEVIAPRQRLTPMGPLPVRAQVEVQAVRDPEPGVENGSLELPLEMAQRLLWGRPVVETLELRDPRDPWRLGSRAAAVLADSGVAVDGLAELHRPLLVALALERVMIFVAVGLMLVVAALNLLCNVAMVAAEKRRDLAVVAALGMPPAGLRRLFLAVGLGIGTLGALVGGGAGVALATVLDRTGTLRLPRGVFVVSSVPFKVDPGAVAVVMASALVLAAVAAWIPARLVARREPVEGLRYE